MRTALAVVLGALLLVCALGFLGYELHRLSSIQTADHDALIAAQDANHSQAVAMAAMEADALASKQQVAALAAQLQAIGATQQADHTAFAQVQAHATPAEKKLLSSQLPAATVQLFKGSATPADPNPSDPPVTP